LPVREAEQAEPDEDEDVLSERAAVEERRRETAEDGDQRGEEAERLARPRAVGDHAGGENARDSNDRREDLDGKKSGDGLLRIRA
jgi:hypothetical protein